MHGIHLDGSSLSSPATFANDGLFRACMRVKVLE